MNANPKLEQPPCPLCGELAGRRLFADDLTDVRYDGPGRFSMLECRSCSLVRLSPRPDQASIGLFYDSNYVPYRERQLRRGGISGSIRSLLATPYRLRYGSLEQSWPPPHEGAKLLDVGCSSGEFIAEMGALGWDVWGIEMNASAASRAALRLSSPEHIFVGGVMDAEYPDESFDVVTASHLIEHVHDPLILLKQLHRWVRPGGCVRIWTPNINSLESRTFGRRWAALDVPRHLFHFAPASLAQLFEHSGFQVTATRPQFQGSSFADSVNGWVAALRGRPAAPAKGIVYKAAAPLGWLLSGLGSRAYLDITAIRR